MKTGPNHTVINSVQTRLKPLVIYECERDPASFNNTPLVCECISCTQVVVVKVEEHQHAAAHNNKHADHNGGDIHRLLVLLLCGLIPLELQVASGGGKKKIELQEAEDAFWMYTTLQCCI